MRGGFTLIELMVVAGIMAFLGAAATGSYNAFQRGMAERGAVGAASSMLKAAKERAQIDRSPTMVFCYNRLLSEATADDNAIAVGEAVAIRRAGRITYVSGDTLADEFADTVGSYDIVDKNDIKERSGFRLWKFDDVKMTDPKYSVVADAVRPLVDDVKMYTYEGWSNGGQSQANPSGMKGQSTVGQNERVTQSGNMPTLVYAFSDLGSGTIQASQWKVGNAYGFEFMKIQLPHNFIFDGNVPSRLDQIANVKVIYFGEQMGKGSNVSDQDINIYRCMPDASGNPKKMANPAGKASSKGNTKI